MAIMSEITAILRLKGGEQFSRNVKSKMATVKKEVATLNNAIAATGLIVFLKKVNETANQAQMAFQGLASVAQFKGIQGANQAVKDLEMVRSGMVSAEDAAVGLKNLLSRGYSLEQATKTLDRLGNAAAYNRSAHLTMGEAIKTASEGLKNENSILVDNAGVTKNVSVMWKEYAGQIGVSVNNMTTQQKIQAELNGIMAETQAQVGDLAKLSNSAAGDQARLEASNRKLAASFGQIYQAISGPFVRILTDIADFLVKSPQWVRNLAAALGVTAIAFKVLNGVIKAFWTSIGPGGWLLLGIGALASAFGLLQMSTHNARLELAAMDTAQAQKRLRELRDELLKMNNEWVKRPRLNMQSAAEKALEADYNKRRRALQQQIKDVEEHIEKMKALEVDYQRDKIDIVEDGGEEEINTRRDIIGRVIEMRKTAIDGLIGYQQQAYEKTRDFFSAQREFLMDFVDQIRAVSSAIGSAIVEGIQGRSDAWKNVLKSFLIAVIDMIEQYLFLAKIKALIDTVINPFAALKDLAPLVLGASLLEAAKGAIMAMAEGTVVTRPTLALVGEAGPEVVAPKRDFIDYSRELMREAVSGGSRGGSVDVVNNFNTPLNDRRMAQRLTREVLIPEMRREKKRSGRFLNRKVV